jgi:antitoxin (DNA-binding transcriptional repressor) of toxin-antitoxin stability system
MYQYIKYNLIMQTITATELARNTRDILDKVVGQGRTINVERNHTMVAQIVPPQPSMTASQAMAGLMIPRLTGPQARAWLKDSRGHFSETLCDPWA